MKYDKEEHYKVSFILKLKRNANRLRTKQKNASKQCYRIIFNFIRMLTIIILKPNLLMKKRKYDNKQTQKLFLLFHLPFMNQKSIRKKTIIFKTLQNTYKREKFSFKFTFDCYHNKSFSSNFFTSRKSIAFLFLNSN